MKSILSTFVFLSVSSASLVWAQSDLQATVSPSGNATEGAPTTPGAAPTVCQACLLHGDTSDREQIPKAALLNPQTPTPAPTANPSSPGADGSTGG